MKRLDGVSRLIAVILTWGIVWAIPGFAIEALSNLGVSIGGDVDIWPMTLGLPGLVAGVLFCALSAVSGRVRALETSSIGVLLGLGTIVGLVMAGIVATGVVGGEESAGTYVFALVMSLVAAVASALLLRFTARREVPARARA